MKNHLISSTLPGLKSIQGHLEHILANTSASAYWKDKDGNYLGVNEVFIRTADLSSHDDVIGSTDLDLIWGEKEALLMQQNDRMIFSSEKSGTTIESATSYQDRKLRYFLNYKTPLLSYTGKPIGVFGVCYILDGAEATSKEIENAGFSSDFIMLNNLQSQIDDTNPNLTARQLDCLYYLAKGFTIKQIAKMLLLSPRTVEHYLDAIKTKLNCETRVELIEKAFKIKAIRYRLLQSLGNIT
jgi:DNA-binding CsgD family transcriptional regulator